MTGLSTSFAFLIPWLALASSVAALALTSLGLLRPRPADRASFRLWALAAASSLAAFTYLATRFLATDLSFSYVFLYTRAGLPWHWRLAGTWAGREGSLLLWATALAVATAAMAWSHARHAALDAQETRGRRWARWFLGLLSAAFLLAVALQDTFAPTSASLLAGRPLGNGLNPTLKSAFILIHPPLMFAAYALSAVPAAAALGHLASGTDRWSRIALLPSRLDWLLYTFAIGLGAMWAYYTLGFGGYWAWDPVEVANLLPWLALTLYLHAQLHHLRHGSYRALGPLLAVLPFLLTLFSTISTRSGLWVSVHAFTDPTDTFDPDPAGRFLGILRVEPSLAFPVALWLATLGVFLGLWCRRLALEDGRFRRPSQAVAALFGAMAGLAVAAPASLLSGVFEAARLVGAGSTGYGLLALTFAAVLLGGFPALVRPSESRAWRIDLRTLAAYAIGALGAALLVLFLFHMAAVNGWSTRFYTARFPWLATPVLLGLLVLQTHGPYGRRRSLALTAGAWAAAALAALLVPGHAGGAYLAVLAFALVVAGLDRVRRAAAAPTMPRSVRRAAALAWLGALLDVLFWSDPPTRIPLGPWSLHADAPLQAFMLAASVLALWQATRLMAGAASRPGWTLLLVGALHGFYLAPALSLAAYVAARKDGFPARPLDAATRARLRQVALYGSHLAMAVLLLGYAPSTYFTHEARGDITVGEDLQLGDRALRYTGTTLEGPAPGAPAEAILPSLDVRSGDETVGQVEGRLEWEPQAQAHFPLPATWRTLTGDLFVDVEAVHVAAGSPCLGARQAEGAWVEAYKGSVPGRVCSGATIDQVRVHAVTLPGLGLVWAAFVLGVASMALLLLGERREGRGQQAGLSGGAPLPSVHQ
ncbi:MAG TPA: cytochrome c biogenesis protein CcsA [Candidatus Thermoplasmatota archaeon]|nr:cytochrome c biogenesis protein CcsA [Candidatus Thermoplasmatota archaeon]